jgi:hypothetical protein
VHDASQHEKFRDNPMVISEPRIRFYAGAPLVTPDGLALGTLCVADQVPRTLTPGQIESLEALCRQAQARSELGSISSTQKALMLIKAEADQQRLVGELSRLSMASPARRTAALLFRLRIESRRPRISTRCKITDVKPSRKDWAEEKSCRGLACGARQRDRHGTEHPQRRFSA